MLQPFAGHGYQHIMLIQRGLAVCQHKMLTLMIPAQCRGARALLEMTQPKLARDAGLGLSTIVDFEKMRREVSKQAIEAMQKALERAGIEFIDENGGGAGVRLRKHRRSRRSTSGH